MFASKHTSASCRLSKCHHRAYENKISIIRLVAKKSLSPMHAHLRHRCLVTLKLNGNPSEKENCGERNYFPFQRLWALSVDRAAERECHGSTQTFRRCEKEMTCVTRAFSVLMICRLDMNEAIAMPLRNCIRNFFLDFDWRHIKCRSLMFPPLISGKNRRNLMNYTKWAGWRECGIVICINSNQCVKCLYMFVLDVLEHLSIVFDGKFRNF